MKIGLDLDGTIGAAPKFFAWLSKVEGAEIHVVTSRDEASRGKQTRNYLRKIGLQYDHLAFTWDKAAYSVEHRLDVFFDDLDHFLLDLPKSVVGFKVRNPGNFNFRDRVWAEPEVTR